MSFNAGSIISKLGLDISPFAQGMLQAQGIINVFPQTVQNFLADPLLGVIGVAKDVASGVAAAMQSVAGSIVGVATEGIQLAAANEQVSISYEVMLGSLEKATALMGEIRAFADTTPFRLDEINNAGKQLLAFGFSGEEVVPTLRRLGDVSAALNIPLGDLSYLFGTTRVQGRMFAQDLNQFVGRGIPLIDQLAQQFGVSKDQVKKLVEEGKVGFPEVDRAIRTLTESGGMFAGMTQRQSQSAAGLWSTMEDAITGVKMAMGQAILEGSNAKGLITELTTFFGALKPVIVEVTTVAVQGLRSTVLPALMDLLAWVQSNLPAIAAVASMVISQTMSAIGGLMTAVGGLWDTLTVVADWVASTFGPIFHESLSNQIAAASPIIDALSSTITSLWTENLQPFFDWVVGTGVPAVMEVFGSLVSFLKPVITGLGQLIAGFVTFTGAMLQQLWKPIIFLWKNILEPLVGWIWTALKPVLQFIGDTVGWLLGKVGKLLSLLGKTVSESTSVAQAAEAVQNAQPNQETPIVTAAKTVQQTRPGPAAQAAQQARTPATATPNFGTAVQSISPPAIKNYSAEMLEKQAAMFGNAIEKLTRTAEDADQAVAGSKRSGKSGGAGGGVNVSLNAKVLDEQSLAKAIAGELMPKVESYVKTQLGQVQAAAKANLYASRTRGGL